MNTTLSAPQATASKHPLPQNAGRDRLSVELPAGDALRRLPFSYRLRLRLALWLLERTPAEAGVRAASAAPLTSAVDPGTVDPRGVDLRGRASETQSPAGERAEAGREARAAYEAARLGQATAVRML